MEQELNKELAKEILNDLKELFTTKEIADVLWYKLSQIHKVYHGQNNMWNWLARELLKLTYRDKIVKESKKFNLILNKK